VFIKKKVEPEAPQKGAKKLGAGANTLAKPDPKNPKGT